MPLSKAKDKQRKRLERAKFRLDKLLCPPQTSNGVQPKGVDTVLEKPYSHWKPDIDADGNVIPEY